MQFRFAYAIMPIGKKIVVLKQHKKNEPLNARHYIQGFFFYGEANRSGLVTGYSSPSNHLHK